MRLRNVLAVTLKDLRDSLRNHFMIMLLVMPLLLSLMFTLFSTSTDENKIEVVIFDQGASSLTERLSKSPSLKMTPVNSEAELKEKIGEGFLAGIYIKKGFYDALMNDERPEVRVYMNSGDDPTVQSGFLSLLDTTIRAAAGQAPVVSWDIVTLNDPVEDASRSPSNYLFALLLLISILMMGTLVVPLLIAEERGMETLAAILISPITAVELIVGKGVVGLAYTLSISALLMLLNQGDWENAGLLSVTIVLGAWMVLSLGLLEAAFLDNAMQVNVWGSMIFLILLLPTLVYGSHVSDPVIRLFPSRYFFEAIQVSIRTGADWHDLFPSWGGMAGIASVFTFLGSKVLHIRLRRV